MERKPTFVRGNRVYDQEGYYLGDVGDFWSDLWDKASDALSEAADNAWESLKDSLDNSGKKELDSIKKKVKKEVQDGIKGEYYTRLVNLVGKEKADQIWNKIKSELADAATPYAAQGGLIVAGLFGLAFFLGSKYGD